MRERRWYDVVRTWLRFMSGIDALTTPPSVDAPARGIARTAQEAVERENRAAEWEDLQRRRQQRTAVWFWKCADCRGRGAIFSDVS